MLQMGLGGQMNPQQNQQLMQGNGQGNPNNVWGNPAANLIEEQVKPALSMGSNAITDQDGQAALNSQNQMVQQGKQTRGKIGATLGGMVGGPVGSLLGGMVGGK